MSYHPMMETLSIEKENDLSYQIIGAAIEVHKYFGGPGLIESIYEASLCEELKGRGLKVVQQLQVPVYYKGTAVHDPLCLDLLVEDSVIIEVKATEKNNPIYEAKLLTYLRLMKLRLGLLINFGYLQVSDSVSRVIN